MELRHLRHFVAVAETRHFGRAAEQLHIAQPALSQSIRQLESQLGAALFVRTTRSVSLTPAGEFLLDEALRALEIVDDSVRAVRQIADGRLGLVRIAFTGTSAFSVLPRIARIIRAAHPELALDIHADLLTPAQVDGLTSRQLDLGVLRLPLVSPDLETRTIAIEQMVVALPPDHRLTEEPTISMSDLRTENFIRYADSHSAVNAAVLSSCHAAGFEPHSDHSAPGTSVLLALVAGGMGVALVPESVRAVSLEGVVYREVTDAATTTLALAWNRENVSSLVSQVIHTLDTEGLFVPLPKSHKATAAKA